MARPKLKICGIRSVDEARQILPLNLDYVGLNFIPISTRYISLKTAIEIVEILKQSSTKTVALFADQPTEMVNDYANQLGIDYVQLHGSETADYTKHLNKPVMKAIPVMPNSQARDIINYINEYPADHFVLDRHKQGRGELISPKLAHEVIDSVSAKIFLAGGLGSDNLASVLSTVNPYGIDIAGGVRVSNRLDRKTVTIIQQIIKI